MIKITKHLIQSKVIAKGILSSGLPFFGVQVLLSLNQKRNISNTLFQLNFSLLKNCYADYKVRLNLWLIKKKK